MSGIIHPALWYTSRTPTEQGQTHCAMARYLGYHAGPHGTGYRRISQSIPLATGSFTHLGVELIGGWLMEYQQAHHGQPPAILPPEVIAWAAAESAARYEAVARSRGFALLADDNPALETLILEQRTLVEALVWVFGLVRVPAILMNYRVLAVEPEETWVLDCTCGLGDGPNDVVHAQRGCTGIVQQGRCDWLLEGAFTHTAGQLAYEELKTKSTPHAPWEKAWEHSGQLLVNMEAASQRLGRSVETAFISILFKGRWGHDSYDAPEDPKYQHSFLCYGYFDQGAPPMRPPQWASQYKWYDDYGKGHTLGKVYRKVPIWDEQYPLTPVREGASRVETWVRTAIPSNAWAKLHRVLGPFPRPRARLPLAVDSIIAEETRWRDDVENIRSVVYSADQRTPLNEIAFAGKVIPRSWQCTRFDGSSCEFKFICDQEPGWEDPLTMGKYQIRRPHHAPERVACEAGGVVFPADDMGEEEGGEGE